MDTEYSQLAKDLDAELRGLVREYQLLSATGDRKVDQVLKKIKLKHPIFNMLSVAAFKYLIEDGFIFKLRPMQTMYKEDQPARANFYIIMYG